MEILEVNKGFEISFPYDPYKVQAVKNIQGARWYGDKKIWFIPSHQHIRVDILRKKFGAVDIEGNSVRSIPEVIEPIPELPELDVELKLLKTPYGFQKKGIAYNRINKRTIIGDQPGLGKSIQAIGTICSYGINEDNMLNAGPGIVICPASLKLNWQKEWLEVAGRKAMILSDKTKNTWKKYYDVGMIDVFICNYESLKKFFVHPGWKKPAEYKVKDIPFNDVINLFKWAVIDESHTCKDTSTQQTKFVMGITYGKEMVMELSGTPVVNNPKDLIAQLYIINRLKDIVSHIPRPKDRQGRFIDEAGVKRFTDRYCSIKDKSARIKEYTNQNELSSRLYKYCFYRRLKSEVLTELPAKTRQVILCEISNRDEYDKAEKEFIDLVKEAKKCTDQKEANKLRAKVMLRVAALKQISARGKIHEVKNFVDDIIASDEKVVVFCWLREIGDRLKEIYPGAVMIRGGMTPEQKNDSVIRFQTDPDTKVIICSIKAAGVGLTLTASSRVAFVEFPWTFAGCEQCEDRTHRIGQLDNVQCGYFLGHETIDKYCYEIVEGKKKMSEDITGAADDVPEEIIDQLLNLFNQR